MGVARGKTVQRWVCQGVIIFFCDAYYFFISPYFLCDSNGQLMPEFKGFYHSVNPHELRVKLHLHH